MLSEFPRFWGIGITHAQQSTPGILLDQAINRRGSGLEARKDQNWNIIMKKDGASNVKTLCFLSLITKIETHCLVLVPQYYLIYGKCLWVWQTTGKSKPSYTLIAQFYSLHYLELNVPVELCIVIVSSYSPQSYQGAFKVSKSSYNSRTKLVS